MKQIEYKKKDIHILLPGCISLSMNNFTLNNHFLNFEILELVESFVFTGVIQLIIIIFGDP